VIRLAADENLNNNIVRGLLRRRPDLDIVRVQDVGLTGIDDAALLAWAAQEGRVVITHDAATMSRHAYDRVRASLAMPGVFEVGFNVPIGSVIDDLLLIAECSVEDEWEGQVWYLPL
jgi:hypothetical protein